MVSTKLMDTTGYRGDQQRVKGDRDATMPKLATCEDGISYRKLLSELARVQICTVSFIVR